MLHTSPKTHEKFALDYDSNGDSYTKDTDVPSLAEIFKRIEEKVYVENNMLFSRTNARKNSLSSRCVDNRVVASLRTSCSTAFISSSCYKPVNSMWLTGTITRKAKSEAKGFSPLRGFQVDFRP